MRKVPSLVGGFLETIDRASSVRDVEAAFLAATAELGFEHAALFSCTPPRPDHALPLSFARVPKAWLQHYIERRYYEIDPVFAAVRRKLTPFSWTDPAYRQGLTRTQKAMLAESDSAGLARGLAIPIKTVGVAAGCCTLVPFDEGIDGENYLVGHSLAVFAYVSAQRILGEAPLAPIKLSKRERECLLLAAKGKSDWAIGEMLSLSERTVHHAIERAKRRYGAATRVQAIVQAIAAGEFSATDALG